MLTKFQDPFVTAKDETRAFVDLTELKTLWFNTGTRCNLSCDNCYIESTPTNDRLSYISKDDVLPYLKELKEYKEVNLIGLTGGEPFLNPHIIPVITSILEYGHHCLVLTNAFNAIKRHKENLTELKKKFQDQLHIRVSLDHYTKGIHEKERGNNTFDKTLEMIRWLHTEGFNLSLAGRSLTNEDLNEARIGYENLMAEINVNFGDKLSEKLVVFPEMDLNKEVPEITTACWDILSKRPEDQMCATERMVVKRKGEGSPVVLPCTLLAYDKQFEMGSTLKDAKTRVQLNHKFCAQFCVLGGASCSTTK